MAELCLGTAQLGMQYGINNKVGKLKYASVCEILDVAIQNGIRVIDTASVYGTAEAMLGDYLNENRKFGSSILLISKQCRDIREQSRNEIEKTIRTELEGSLERLKRRSIDGYLLHAYKEVCNRDTINVLQKLKDEGLVHKIGVSIYDIDEANRAMESSGIDYLQMPCSLFDQRGMTSGIFRKAHELGIKVFTRSAFLQGLLMMEVELVPNHLKDIIPYLTLLNDLLKKYDLEKKHAIVKFILSESLIDYMVFGVETKEQLEEIIAENESEPLPQSFVEEIKEKFCIMPDRLILPIHWPK